MGENWNRVGIGIDDLKISLRIFVVSENQNSPPQLFENEEHNLNFFERHKPLYASNYKWNTVISPLLQDRKY